MSHGRVPAIGRIVLVGFMAAGKTTVGRLLADEIGWRFVDFDVRIEERTGRTPADLIRERGEPAFRDLEAELTEELAGIEKAVLAPGGGWVTRPELADRLGAGTVTIWLRVSADEAVRRAEADATDRPLLGPVQDRAIRARALLERRAPLYARAELVVDVDGREPVVVVDEILGRLGLQREDNGQ